MEASQHSGPPTRIRLKVYSESRRPRVLWHPRILFATFQFGLADSFLPGPDKKVLEHDAGLAVRPFILCNDFPHDVRCIPAAIPSAN